jgi:hypothetical protein
MHCLLGFQSLVVFPFLSVKKQVFATFLYITVRLIATMTLKVAPTSYTFDFNQSFGGPQVRAKPAPTNPDSILQV